LSLSLNAIQDMSGNNVVAISSSSAQAVQQYTADTTRPQLLNFTYNANSNVDYFVLTFDETVDVSRIVFNAFTFQSSANGGTSYQLSSGAVLTANAPVVKVQLSDNDRNGIKLLTGVATSGSNTFLSMAIDGIRDMAVVSNGAAAATLATGSFVGDTTRPVLLTYVADMNNGTLLLNFNEPVDVATLDVTKLILQSHANEAVSDTFRLTSGGTSSSNGLQVLVQMTDTDLNNIKKREYLYVNSSSAYLQVEAGFIKDMAGNQIVAIPNASAQAAALYITDTTRPRVVSFSLDMTAETLTILFSETVDVRSYNASAITLQSSSNAVNAADAYTLTTSALNNAALDDPTIVVHLSLVDMNELKRLEIGNRVERTWLVVTEYMIKSQFANAVLPLLNGVNAMNAVSYHADVTAPVLLKFDLSEQNNALTLYFSETIRASTFAVSAVTVQGASAWDGSNLSKFSLTGSSQLAAVADGTVLVVQLSSSDYNEVKRRPSMCTSSANTYLSITAGLVADMYGNSISPINVSSALIVSFF